MPIVPQVQGPSVGMAPAPNVRAPVEAFGGGQAARPVDLSGVGDVVNKLRQDALYRANQIAAVDNGSQLSGGETTILRDPQTGVLNLRGRDAAGAIDQAHAQWQKVVEKIRPTLTNDDQRVQFERMAADHWASINEQVQAHMSAEGKRYDTDATSAYLTNETNAAAASYQDPARVQQSIDRQVAAIRDFGKRNGAPDATVKEQIASATSKTRMSVLEQMLNTEQDVAASDYFRQHRQDFVGSDLMQAEKLTDQGSLRAGSQQQADTITTTATDLQAALKSVRGIQDPKLRDATEERVRRFYADKASDERQQREDAWNQAGALLEQTKDINKIPLSIRAKLTATDNESLSRREDQLRHPKVETDMGLYTHLINLSALNDATRSQFLSINFGDQKYRGSLSDSDLRYMANLQRELRQADVRTEKTDEHKDDAAQRALRVKTERDVIKASDKASADAAARASAERMAPGSSKYMAPPARVVVPKWMTDSAAADPEYADYLKRHGVKMPTTTPPPNAPGLPGASDKPKVPGAPITTPGTP